MRVKSVVSTEIVNARIFAHRSNIERYSKLLRTCLTEHEREFVEGRLSEEETALQKLLTDASEI
jgi:hypothetical protein